jgi:hypothetical protein
MLAKLDHFVSYEHFLRELMFMRFPDIHDQALQELDSLTEGAEGAMNFFLKFQWLCGLCNRDPNESTALFIDKLKFNEIKKAVRMANFTNAERYEVPYPESQIESDVQRMLFRHKEFEDLVKSFSTIPK